MERDFAANLGQLAMAAMATLSSCRLWRKCRDPNGEDSAGGSDFTEKSHGVVARGLLVN
jgi:hypothetical protein